MMRAGVLVLLVVALVAPVALAEEPSEPDAISCTLTCHGMEATSLKASVHAHVLSCVDCHGGDPTAFRDEEGSHAVDAGFIGTPSREQIPASCDTCHADSVRMRPYALRADQGVQYRTSSHGLALFERGDTTAAVCTDCHGTHGILRTSDPRSPTAPENQPETCGRCHEGEGADGRSSDSVSRFRDSVHGRALLDHRIPGAPSCADCHGAHGAAPPGVEDAVQVCGRCHAATREHFERSPHVGIPEMGCPTCHGTHAVRPAGAWLYRGEEEGRCTACHEDDEAAETLIQAIASGRERLVGMMAETTAALESGKARGLWFEHEESYLRESSRTLVSVRPLTHSLIRDEIEKHIADGLAGQERTREDIRTQEAVLRDRKIVLFGLIVLLFLLTGLLVLKLRAVRRLS